MMIKQVFTRLTLLAALFITASTHAAIDSKGTDFFLSFSENIDANTRPTVLITSEFNANGTIEVPGISYVQSFTVPAGEVVSIELPASVIDESDGGISNKGIRVVSDVDITVYGLNQRWYSTDAFLALPVDAVGIEYLTMNYRGNFGNQIMITGIYDNTQVTIIPAAGGIGFSAGQPITITLNRFENYYMRSARGSIWTNANTDYTGTIIRASAPVSVTSGDECARVPVGQSACDHLVEMMPPVSAWGKSFLTVPLAIRIDRDPVGDVFRVLAANNDTVVTINNIEVATLNRGEFYETRLSIDSQISANKPVLLAQYSTGAGSSSPYGDPFMMLVPPTEQFLNQYNFSTTQTNYPHNFVNVVAPTSSVSSLSLDGVALDSSLFTPIGDSTYSGAQISISPGQHNITGVESFGIYVYGLGDYESYGYTGGMSFELINPQGDIYPPNVKLTQLNGVIQGVANDTEDQNVNGLLELGEDLNLNGVIDPRSEDINNNSVLDAGEDTNDNAILDRDTGVFRVELEPESINLQVQYDPYVPGISQLDFTVSPIDANQPARGVLAVVDGAGNRTTRNIILGNTGVLNNVRVVSTLSTDQIDLDNASFTVPPYSTSVLNGATIIEWRFAHFDIGQVQDLAFDIYLRNPNPGETRLVTQSLDLYFTDINGNEVHTAQGFQSVQVESSIHTVTVNTERSQYVHDENVLINGVVSSLSDFTSTTTVKVTVKDSTGALVSELGAYPNISLPAGGSFTLPPLQFYTNGYYEGMYQVHVELLDANGNAYIQATAPFVITAPSDAKVTATISTDKLSYSPYETVHIQDRIRNVVPNAIVDNFVATTTVFEPAGMAIWTETVHLPQLLPDSLRDYTYSVPLGRALAGTYKAQLVIKDEQGIERVLSETNFTVQSSSQTGSGITGSISASPHTVLKSENLSISADLRNLGNANVQNLPVTVSIVDPANSQIIQQWTETVPSLPIQGVHTVAYDWQAIAPIGATYIAILSIDIGGQTRPIAQNTFVIGEKFTSQISIGERGRLLVWIGESRSCRKSEQDDKSSSVKTCPSLIAQQAYLEDHLQEAGWQQYTVVTERDDFLAALRSGSYQVYVLLGQKDELYDQIEDELTEAVHRGEGLIIANGKDDPDAALGVDDRQGGLGTGIELHQSEYHDAEILAFHEAIKIHPVQLAGATSLAEFASSPVHTRDSGSTAAITQFTFGHGKSMYFGFDLLEQAYFAPESEFMNLLLSALDDVHPVVIEPRTGSVVPLTLQIQNHGVAADGRVVINLGDATLLDADGVSLVDENTLEILFSLGENQILQHTIWVQLPKSLTTTIITARIQSGTEPNLVNHGEVVTQINVIPSPVISDIQAQLSELEASNPSYQKANNYVSQANSAIAKGNLSQALDKLLEAAEELGEIRQSEDAITLRAQLDWLIRDLALSL